MVVPGTRMVGHVDCRFVVHGQFERKMWMITRGTMLGNRHKKGHANLPKVLLRELFFYWSVRLHAMAKIENVGTLELKAMIDELGAVAPSYFLSTF